MRNTVCLVVNMVVFGAACEYFGLWVAVPLSLVYFVGAFQGASA